MTTVLGWNVTIVVIQPIVYTVKMFELAQNGKFWKRPLKWNFSEMPFHLCSVYSKLEFLVETCHTKSHSLRKFCPGKLFFENILRKHIRDTHRDQMVTSQRCFSLWATSKGNFLCKFCPTTSPLFFFFKLWIFSSWLLFYYRFFFSETSRKWDVSFLFYPLMGPKQR